MTHGGDGRPEGRPDGRGDTAADLTPPGGPVVAGPVGTAAPAGVPAPAGSSILPAVPRQVPPPVFPPAARPRPTSTAGPSPAPARGAVGQADLPGDGVHGAHRAGPGGGPGTPTAPPAPPAPTSARPAGTPVVSLRRLRGWQATSLALGLVTVLLVSGAVYLWRTSDAWQQRAEDYEAANHDLGSRLADERAQLEATTADLTEVRDQLATAQTRIIELANEKAQLGDDREAQRMLADYQERVSDAVGRVAKALDQCVQGQDQLISYMRDAALYDQADLDAYSTSVQQLCQQATDANARLQDELSR